MGCIYSIKPTYAIPLYLYDHANRHQIANTIQDIRFETTTDKYIYLYEDIAYLITKFVQSRCIYWLSQESFRTLHIPSCYIEVVKGGDNFYNLVNNSVFYLYAGG